MMEEAFNFKSPGQYEYDGVIFNDCFKAETLREIKEDLKFRDDDVVVITFPKSGTTWMQAIMKNVAGFGRDDNEDLFTHIPYMELAIPNMDMFEMSKTLPSPRMIKSHLPYPFLENAFSGTKAKAIIVMRNPKDTMVSYYHFYRKNKLFGCFPGSFDDFFKLFMKGELIYGNWFDYTKGYWMHKNEPNFLFVKYEDIKANPLKIVKEVAGFIGKEIPEEYAQRVVNMTTFEKMKPIVEATAKKANFLKEGETFMRKGMIGDWKSHLTVAQNEIFDKEYRDIMKGCDLEFTFE